jgi:hypothetical protein
VFAATGFLQQFANHGLEFGGFQVFDLFAKHREYQVGAGFDTGIKPPDNLVEAAPDTVARNGRLADLTADDDRDTIGLFRTPLGKFQAYQLAADSLSALVGAAQAAIAMETVGAADHLKQKV